MCFSRIASSEDVEKYATSYRSHHDHMETLQYVAPVVGIVFSAGVLLHDLKAYAVNKLFVDKTLQGDFAKATYSGTVKKTSDLTTRILAALNILSGGIALPLVFLALMIHHCCCGSQQ